MLVEFDSNRKPTIHRNIMSATCHPAVLSKKRDMGNFNLLPELVSHRLSHIHQDRLSIVRMNPVVQFSHTHSIWVAVFFLTESDSVKVESRVQHVTR